MRRRKPDMPPWRVSRRCRGNSHPISASSSMTIWRRRKASGAASKTSPTVPRSKVSIGSPPGTGISDGPTASSPSSLSAPMRMERRRSSCRLPSPRARHQAAVLVRPGTVRLQRAAAGARFFAARCARALPRRLARPRQQMQRDPQLRHDWIELEKMPQMVGTQINPFLSLELLRMPPARI